MLDPFDNRRGCGGITSNFMAPGLGKKAGGQVRIRDLVDLGILNTARLSDSVWNKVG